MCGTCTKMGYTPTRRVSFDMTRTVQKTTRARIILLLCACVATETPPRCKVSRATPWQETYLGQHNFAKRKKLGIPLTKMRWLLWRKSKFSTSKKLLIYKTLLKPIWTYGIQPWGTASTSGIEILERFQSRALHMVVDVPWYVPNTVIRRNFQIPTVKEEICRYSSETVLASVHTQMTW
jgi:hypothetical protein